MQTFLPVADFRRSAYYLDDRRLWKQCLEAWELWNILANNKESRWKNHPACLMWKGYEDALRYYIEYYRWEWQDIRKKNNNTIPIGVRVPELSSMNTPELPWWLGKEQFHKSHRIALLTKNFEHYKHFGWKEQPDPNYKYFWPVIKCFHCRGMGVVMDEDGGVQCPYCHGTKIMNNAITAFDVVIESPTVGS